MAADELRLLLALEVQQIGQDILAGLATGMENLGATGKQLATDLQSVTTTTKTLRSARSTTSSRSTSKTDRPDDSVEKEAKRHFDRHQRLRRDPYRPRVVEADQGLVLGRGHQAGDDQLPHAQARA